MNSIKKIIFFLILGTSLYAQTSSDSSKFATRSFPVNSLMNRFDKQLNTYNFATGIDYSTRINNLFVGLNEKFNSTIIRSSVKNIKEEQNLSLISEYSFSPFLSFGLLMDNNIYSDDRKLAINQASNLSTSIYSRFQPSDNFSIIPFAGYSNNQQIGEKDNGFIYGSEALIEDWNLFDLNINSIMRFQNEDISPRKNTNRLINFRVLNQFENSILNGVTAFYSQQRRDFYFEADSLTSSEFNVSNNIQSRTETNYFLQDNLKFVSIGSALSMSVLGRISYRDIDRNTRYISLQKVSASSFDTKIEEFKIDFGTTLHYNSSDFNGNLKITYSEREEKHLPKNIDAINRVFYDEKVDLENQKNNKSQLATVSVSGNWVISNHDRVSFSIYQRKLKYDTPSDKNFDDRDELLTIGRLYYVRKITPFFNLFANLEGSINKIVYIYAERSSNNNIKRVVKFTTGGIYKGARLTSLNSAEVSANYTVYDFEELNPNLHSFAFRQFVYRDSTIYSFNKRVRLSLNGYIKLSEQGDFNWKDFSAKPQRYLQENYFESKIIYEIAKFNLGFGLRYFELSTYNYDTNNQKNKLSNYKSIGPLSEITYYVDPSINLRLYGYYEFINNESNNRRELANLNLQMNWRF